MTEVSSSDQPMTFEPTVPSGRSEPATVPSTENAEDLAHRASLQPGRIVVDKYRIERALATGGMGLVCLATHLVLNERVILKFVRPDLASNDEAVERLLVEARLAAKLRGKHFARIHDAGRLEDGVPYLAMEYLEGHTLAEELEARGGVLPEAEAVEWTLQACSALEECHEIGIVHRDVKPENLFLAKTAREESVLKLIDFGISKHVDVSRGQRRITNPGESLGSPWYMAPEQMRTPHLVDRRADIWSLGVVLFQLVTGRVPFDGDTLAEVCAQVLCEEPLPLSAAASAVGPGLSAIVARCLSKNPDQRYETAAALANALSSPAAAAMADLAVSDVHAADLDVEIDVDVDVSEASLPRGAAPGGSSDTPPACNIAAPTPIFRIHKHEFAGLDELDDNDIDISRDLSRVPGERRWGPAFMGLGMIAAAITSVVLLVPEARAKAATLAAPYTEGWLTPAKLDLSIPQTEVDPLTRPVLTQVSAPPPSVAKTAMNAATGEKTVPLRGVATGARTTTGPRVRTAPPATPTRSREPDTKLSPEEVAARKARYDQYLEDNGLVPVEEALKQIESGEISEENPY